MRPDAPMTTYLNQISSKILQSGEKALEAREIRKMAVNKSDIRREASGSIFKACSMMMMMMMIIENIDCNYMKVVKLFKKIDLTSELKSF